MTGKSGARSIAESARELVHQAAEAGMDHPRLLLECTPAEIEMEMKALHARREMQMQQMDLLAWLAGRYVMLAVHAPRRYPRRPDGIRMPHPDMTDDQMKQVFAAIAARRRDEVGSG